MMPDTYNSSGNNSGQRRPDASDPTMTEDPRGTVLPQNPDEARAEDDPQATGEAISAVPESYLTNRRDLETHLDMPVNSTVDTPDRDKPQSREGKLVFSPDELNQSGEDKEYFHPRDDHKFVVPSDANAHALTPDVEVAPGNTVKPIPDKNAKPA